jgi:hypothetical protein
MGERTALFSFRLASVPVGIVSCKAACKACAKYVIVGKRSCGALARALRMTCSVWGDTSGQILLKDGGASMQCCTMTARGSP